jgi:hypothetical protein
LRKRIASVSLRATLYLSQKLIGQSRKATHAGAVQMISGKDVAGTFVSPVRIVTVDKIYDPQFFNFQRISR